MPGYIKTLLRKYNNEEPTRPQHAPYPDAPKKYGKYAHKLIPQYKFPRLDKDGIKYI